MADTILQPAWLLHYTNFRDTSFIVDMFTLGSGRVSLLARGARSARSRSRALYQPFRPLLLTWIDNPHSELRTLTGLEESGPALDMDSRALACAYYLNELCLRLLGKHEAQPELFAYYGAGLARLCEGADVDEVLRGFELQLLDTLGVLPDLARCNRDGQAIDPDLSYRFFAANALAVPISEGVEPGRHADGETADAGVEVSGATLIALSRFDLPDAFANPSFAREARDVMRSLVALQLGGKPLRSRELFSTMTGGAIGGAGDGAGDGAGEDPQR